ncbi:hypothetical protein ABS768_05355 [Flavobacterium sp. ST-75]|uniref:Zinc ribbon domain-containing protein n=1 Tax=Flavobacterium rhizophilum TaxID=3163296 RepID=A0ABW8Y9P3_9FLAO
MKPCLSCGNMLAEDATFCYVCNTEQKEGFEQFEIKPKQSDVFLKVLCILTILSMGFNLITSLMNLITSPRLSHNIDLGYPLMPVFIASAIISVSKLTGAIFMLQKKLKGLYIYTVAAGLSIIITIYTTISIFQNFDIIFTLISVGTGLFFGLLFVVLYWLPVNRKLLS